MLRNPCDIVNDLIGRYASLREFARTIQEDSADVMRWRYGRSNVTPRAVIKICQLHPEISPHELNPNVFPANLIIKFTE